MPLDRIVRFGDDMIFVWKVEESTWDPLSTSISQKNPSARDILTSVEHEMDLLILAPGQTGHSLTYLSLEDRVLCNLPLSARAGRFES